MIIRPRTRSNLGHGKASNAVMEMFDQVFYPVFYGFSGLGAAGSCPQKTKFTPGRGCCLPANLHFKNKLTCCNRSRDITVNEVKGTGKYSLICKDAKTVPVDGNGGGGTRVGGRDRSSGFESEEELMTDSGIGMGTIALIGGGLLIFMLAKKKKGAPAAGATK